MKPYRAASLLLLSIPLAGCFDDKDKAAAPPPTEVSAVEVQPADLPLAFEYSGRTAGSREVEVRARINGIITKRRYVEGEKVRAGQVLFQLDPEVYRAALDRSAGLLGDQQALLRQSKADYDRISRLYKEKAISGREFDEAKAAYMRAKAGVETAGAQVRSSKIDVNYTTVTAPITGVTSRENRSEGSYIQANSENSLLTRITQLDPLYVNFAFPDSDALAQRSGVTSGTLKMPSDQKLPVTILSADGTPFPTKGTVSFTDSFIDPATGSVNARATLSNKDGALLPGQFVRVRVEGFVRPNSIAVPAKAVMQGPQGTFVYVVTPENKAGVKPVKLGMLSPKGQIVESGLEPGDKVITEGVIKIRPDAPVKVVTPEEAAAASAGQGAAGGAASSGSAADGHAQAGTAKSGVPAMTQGGDDSKEKDKNKKDASGDEGESKAAQ